ncbi:MAG: hypothetical protein ACJA0U_000692 [Salibacteraceae bacterium]|jgi:hypothetical protein
MKIAGLILYFLFLSGVSTAQDCEKYKTGKFLLIDKNYEDYRLVRTKNMQAEIVDGKTFEFKLKWINECTYKLKPKRSNAVALPKVWVYNQIIKTGDDYYIVQSWVEGTDEKLKMRVQVAE